MGALTVTEFVSIDGVFEDSGGAETYEHGGWNSNTTVAPTATSTSSTS